MLVQIILATFLDSLTGLLGIFSIFFSLKNVKKFSGGLVAFAAGAMISAAFLIIIPESFELNLHSGELIMLGFIAFFFLERLIHMRHHHKGKCETSPVSFLVIIGDGIHNIIDGLVIAAAFLINSALGWTTTLAILAHEVPQEIGNFGILIHHGFSKNKAIIWTFISQSTCILGGIMGFFLGTAFSKYLLPIAAGGFVYIAAVDLIPELHTSEKIKKSFGNFSAFIFGVVLLWALKMLMHTH